MDYHVFKKTKVNAKGKKIKYWYYYYVDDTGKQIQKVCKNCKSRAEAESFIRALPPLKDEDKTLIKDIAKTMYLRGSKHMTRRIQLGKSISAETMSSLRHYVVEIIDRWGDFDIQKIDPSKVVEFLFTVDRSGSWKNSYIAIFKEIYQEAIWYGCKISTPAFPSFAKNYKKADIFTTEELRLIFQKENFPNEMMYLFFLLCLSGGMRLGEVRGVRVKQIVFDKKILIIDGFCKKDGFRTVYNKKGSIEKPKLRIVPLPDVVLKLMYDWVVEQKLQKDDFCFTQNGKPISGSYARDVLYRVLKKIGLIVSGNSNGKTHLPTVDGRKLVPHSFRYTYVSRMLRTLSSEDLKFYTGHSAVGMVDYYNRSSLELELAKMPKKGEIAVNSLFE